MYDPCKPNDPCSRLGGLATVAAGLKGEPVMVFGSPPQQTARLSDKAIDMGPYNMVTVQVWVTGTSPSAVVSVEGGAEQASSYLPVADPNGSKTITASTAFDVICGSRWAKIRIASVSGTFLDGQGYVVWVTPYVSPGQPRVTADHIGAGQTAYDTGIGWWLEYNAGTPRFSIGNPAGNKMLWDGSALTVTGTISAILGSIGGWTIGTTALTAGAGANTVGLDSGGTNPAIYAGSATPGLAPFRVTQAGALVASSATITGEVNASSGSITGTLTVSGALQNAASPNARYVLDSTGLKLYDATNTQRAQLLNDGSGWLGDSAVLAWTTAGVVTLNGSAVMANTITGGKVNFFNVPTIDGLVLTNNSPIAGSVAWSSFTLTYQGTSYTVVAGNSALKFLYWNKATSTTVLQASATPPAQAADQFIVAFNESGTAVPSLFANIVYADYISAATLAAIQANIGAAHIDGVLDIATAGGIYQGTGSFATPTTGLKIYNSSGIGRIAAYNAAAEMLRIGDLNGGWGYVAETYGVALGEYGATKVNLTMDTTNGLRIRDNTTVLGQWATDGSLTIGEVAASKSNVYISAGEVDIRLNTTVVAKWQADGTIVIGPQPAADTTLALYAGGIYLRNGTTERIALTGGGILTIKDSGGAAVFSFDASAGAEFTKPLTLGTSGGIYQGTGTFASPTTGLKVWNDGGVGRIGGYNATVPQWYASTDGKLYAGAGAVTLDANGVSIAATDTLQDVRSYKFLTGTTLASRLSGRVIGTPTFQNFLGAYVAPITGYDSIFRATADAPTGRGADIILYASAVGASDASFSIGTSAASGRYAVLATDYLQVGTTPAGSGVFRIPNNQWIAAAAAGAGDVNLLRLNASDKLEFGLTWTDWTPTVTQGVSVAATVDWARYCLIGKLALVQVHLSITGSGTATSPIGIDGQPAALYSARTGTYARIGGAFVLDASPVAHYEGSVMAPATTTWRIISHGSTGWHGTSPAQTLASGDVISFVAAFEVA